MLMRSEGRSLFGLDPEGYAAGRPPYPRWVFDVLRSRCGLRPTVRVLEVGPGTGLATRPLVEAGASVVAVEPDPGLARHLRVGFGDAVEVVEATLEDARLPDGFDLAVAATSFHWVDQHSGLSKLGQAVRPGGWVAIWWTRYRDPDAPDGFTRGVEAILGPATPGEFDEPGRPAFQVDSEHRCRDMSSWGGLAHVSGEIFTTTSVLTATQLRALYGSMAVVRRRSPQHQQEILEAIERLAGERHGGNVERQFTTALYTGRRPG